MTNIILSIWITDSRFKAQKKILQSNLFGVKIQGWRPSDSRSFCEILNLESYPLGFKNFFLRSWILNLESYPLGFKIFFWDLESWILNPTPLDSRSLFGILNLESYPLGFKIFFLRSWILNLESDILREGWDGNKFANICNFWSPKSALSFRVQNVEKNTVNTTKFAWKVGLGGVIYIYTYIYIYRHIYIYMYAYIFGYNGNI